MEAGTQFLHLKEFTQYMINDSHQSKGLIVENFANVVDEFLIYYQNQVNECEK